MSDTGGIPLNVNIEDNATLDLQFDCLKVEIDNGRSRDGEFAVRLSPLISFGCGRNVSSGFES